MCFHPLHHPVVAITAFWEFDGECAFGGGGGGVSMYRTIHIQLWFLSCVLTCQLVPEVTQHQEVAVGKA